jgi:hypothetical protein
VNARVFEETIDGLLVTVEDSENAVGKAGFLPQFGKPDCGRRILLGRLEHDGVASCDGDGEEPHRHHRGKVERADDSDNTERLTDRVHVDTRRHVLAEVALEHLVDSARELDDFLSSGDLTESIGKHLAVFGGEDFGELALLGVEQLAEVEDDGLTTGERHVAPFGERGVRTRNGLVDVGLVCQNNTLRFLAEGRIENGSRAVRGSGIALSTDPVGDGVRCHVFSFGCELSVYKCGSNINRACDIAVVRVQH